MKIIRMSNSSWFKLITDDIIIHIDPGYSGEYNFSDMKEELADPADLILISHVHRDHMQDSVLKTIVGDQTTIYASKSCHAELKYLHEVFLPLEEKEYQGIKIKSIFAYNTPEGQSSKKFHPKDDFLGFIIDIHSFVIYFAGDTDITSEMKALKDIDLALLPIGGTYVMDLEEAIQATKLIKPTYVIPMHQATTDLLDFKKGLDDHKETEVIVLYPKDAYTFK